jgi:hypothetical protein
MTTRVMRVMRVMRAVRPGGRRAAPRGGAGAPVRGRTARGGATPCDADVRSAAGRARAEPVCTSPHRMHTHHSCMPEHPTHDPTRTIVEGRPRRAAGAAALVADTGPAARVRLRLHLWGAPPRACPGGCVCRGLMAARPTSAVVGAGATRLCLGTGNWHETRGGRRWAAPHVWAARRRRSAAGMSARLLSQHMHMHMHMHMHGGPRRRSGRPARAGGPLGAALQALMGACTGARARARRRQLRAQSGAAGHTVISCMGISSLGINMGYSENTIPRTRAWGLPAPACSRAGAQAPRRRRRRRAALPRVHGGERGRGVQPRAPPA